jgi:hypothetical protein
MADFLKNEQGVKDMLIAVRDAAQKRSWVAFGYEGEDTTISVLGQGTGGIVETEPFLQDKNVVYILYSYVVAESDGGAAVIEMLKYILITFVGGEVKPLHRARSTQHRVYLYNFAQPFLQLAGEMQAVHKDEVTENAIAQKLSGSRLEQHTDSTTSDKLTGGRTGTKPGQDRAHFVDQEAAISAVKAIRADSDPLRWIAWRYQPEVAEDPEALVEVSRGSGGYNEVEPLFKPASVIFVLLALDTKSEGDYASTKYTLITWCSDDVRPMHKARSAQDRLQLVTIFNQHLQLSAEWQATTLSEISEEKLLHKLQGSIIQEEKVVSNEPRAKATINDGVSKFNPDFKPNTATVKVDWDADQESVATTAIQSLRDAKTNWALFGYAGTSNKISFLQQGNGDWTEVDALLDDKNVYYAIIGVAFGLGDYVQNKYIFLNWIGSKAKPTVRARSSQHRVALYAFAGSIFPLAGEMQALAREDATSENIRKKLIGTTQLSEEQQQLAERSSSPAPGGSGNAEASSSTGVEKFELVDAAGIETVLKKVRDDSNTTNWVSFKYAEDGSYKIQLDREGHGGVEEIKPLLKDDTILYLVVGVVQTEVDYQTVKYIFVTFIGPNVKPLHKARSSQHRVKLYNHFGQFLQLAGELQLLTADDLSEVALISKLSGSRMVSGAMAKTAARRATVSKGSMEKFAFADETAALAALESLRKDTNEWVVFGSPEGKPELVGVLATGKGQIDAVKAHFGDEQVRYAVIAFKVVEVVEDVDYTRAKNIFISWCGPEVKPLAKARSSQQRVPIYEYCLKVLPLHGQIHAEKSSDLNENEVLEKFSGARTQISDKIEKEAARLKELEAAKASSSAGADGAENTKVDISTFFKQTEQVTPLLKQLYAGTLNWVALGYLPNDETTVVLLESGNSGIDGFKSLLQDNQVLYVVTAVKEDNRDASHQADDHATLEGYATTKFVQVNWVGKDVKPLQRARSSQHRVALATQLVGVALQLSAELPATHLEEVTEITLRDKITGSRVKV